MNEARSPRPWVEVDSWARGSWTVEASDVALGRTPPFGQRFFAELFAEYPTLVGRATFMRWSVQPSDIYVFFDPACEFSVQVDVGLEYLIVSGPPDEVGEFGDWDGDQVAPAMDQVRVIASHLGI